MRRVAGVAATVAALVAAAPASATHRDGSSDNASCVAQFVVPGAHAGRYGEFVSFLAHMPGPLGQLVSMQARGERDDCPF